MSEMNLQDKFPDMKPLNGAPTLWTVNSIGVAVYGRRDIDPETATYVKTRAICAVFVPLFFIDAYRVADAASGGWYFIGRVPMSSVAKLWNAIVVAAIAVSVGTGYWNSYVNSPPMVAKRQLDKADAAAAEAEFARAAEIYSDVAASGTEHQSAAIERLWGLLDEPRLSELSPQDSAQFLNVLVRRQKQQGSQDTAKRIIDCGLSLADKSASADASGADRVLDSIASLAGDDERFQKARRGILEQIIKQEPKNVSAASKLALAYEALGEIEACERLLTPLSDRLAGCEGARILGQILAGAGKFDEAHALLAPYCEQRLAMLHNAETSYEDAYSSAYDQALDGLREGAGPESFYSRYDAANETEQGQMVDEYLAEQIGRDASLALAREALISQADIVPVAIDLGVVLLRRAQETPDPEVRQAELERAEKTFRAIRGIAGESDEYRIYMGQVNYWLGKHEEGHQLFEEMLTANDRSPQMLMAIASMLREVGLSEESRERVEEAYESGTTQEEEYTAAAMRAANFKDVDDHIVWLRKCDPNDNSTQASLAGALGDQAMMDGDYEVAERQYRASIAAYTKLTENPASLNNGAIPRFSLFILTGDRTHFEKGIEMLERAISLSPSDSILLKNAAHSITAGSVETLLSSQVDLRVLGIRGDIDLLGHLYDDEVGRAQLLESFGSHPGIAKALELHHRELVLAPKRAGSYGDVQQLLELAEDVAGLKALLRQIQQAQPDTSAETNKLLQFYRGEIDDDMQKDFDRNANRMSVLVERSRQSAPGATFAVAVDELVDANYATYILRPVENLDALVALAEEAFAGHASFASRINFAQVLLLRACQTMEETDEEFAAYARQTKRSIDAGRMIALLGGRGGSLSDRVAQNPDVQRAVEVVAENATRLPKQASAWRWALLRHWAPEEAAKLQETLLADRTLTLSREINLLLNPASVSGALDQYWAHLLAGEEEQAKAVLRACADQGVPIPDFE